MMRTMVALSDIGDLEQFTESLRWTLAGSDRLRDLKKASRAKAAEYDIKHVANEYELLFSTEIRAGANSKADHAL